MELKKLNFFLILFVITSCSYNSFEDKFDGGSGCFNVSYASDISPIISTNCAISGCHAGSQFPDLRIFSNVQSNANTIKSLTQSRAMPKKGSLTPAEISLIGCWVDNGAPDN